MIVCYSLLLDIPFIPKVDKPLTGQCLEETQTKSTQDEEHVDNTGNNNWYVVIITLIL